MSVAAVAFERDVAAADTEAATFDLEVADLAVSLGDHPVFSDIGFRVERGESIAIIGPNGAGKSTLLRSIVRLIEPRRGAVRLAGREVLSLRERDLRNLRARIGFVFQRHNLVSRLSALTNVVHGAQARSSGPRTWLQSLAPAAVRDEGVPGAGRPGPLGAPAPRPSVRRAVPARCHRPHADAAPVPGAGG